MAFKFENLKVWQRAVELTGDVDELTKSFPKEERYILTSQMKRAADSIALNIGEARRRKIITQTTFDRFYKELTEIIKMIQALRNSLK